MADANEGLVPDWWTMPHGIERELAKYDQCEEPGDCDHDHDNAIEYLREQELAELREQLAAATARAETAEAAYHRLDSAQAAAGSYAGRAEAAEAKLAAVLGLHREADAQDGDWEHGSHWPCVICHDGPWPCATRRAADATPHADLERLAAEKGVQPVTSIDQFTAPGGERLSDEEFAAWTAAWECNAPCCRDAGDGEGGGDA